VRPEDVPSGPLLIDTDVFSWITWQRDRFREFDALVEGHVLALSFATVAELRAGVLISGWGDKRRRTLEDRIAQYVVLTATDPVTQRFAEIYARFRGRLKGGGVNDMWIAATALAQPHRPPIVTGNRSDFEYIASAFPLVIVHPDAPAPRGDE
jgi:predicted nucleic acid-binding protein